MKPALIVIDVQKAFMHENPVTTRSLENAIEYINYYIALFRQFHLPVICVQHINTEEGLVPGSEGFDVPETLAIAAEDLHIHKTYGNAFNKTELLAKCTEMGVDTLFLTGFEAENCVLSTYRGTKDVDLTPILIRDTLASSHPENIPFVERISDSITYNALKKWLGSL